MAVTPTIIFPVNSMNGDTECSSVPIVGNMAFEKDETFSLQIDSVEQGVMISSSSASVVIQDDDSK